MHGKTSSRWGMGGTNRQVPLEVKFQEINLICANFAQISTRIQLQRGEINWWIFKEFVLANFLPAAFHAPSLQIYQQISGFPTRLESTFRATGLRLKTKQVYIE